MDILKRVSYISKFAIPLSKEDIEKIAEISQKNNSREKLTGVLFTYKNIFYQIIEGPERNLDKRLNIIFNDNRHKDIFVLKVEKNVEKRKFSEWSMKTVILDESQDYLIQPLTDMLNTITDSWILLEKYVSDVILKTIQKGENPLDYKPQFKDKIILFGDIFASTTFTEILNTNQVFDLFEIFFEITIDTINKYGGNVSKLLGDGFLGSFSPDYLNNALNAIIEISKQLKILRNSYPENHPYHYLYAGFGMSKGKILEGNIGSKNKKDYTYIGRPVNLAAKIQAITRKTNYVLIFDESLLDQKIFYEFKKIGKYLTKNQVEIQLYTLNHNELKSNLNYDNLIEKIKQLK